MNIFKTVTITLVSAVLMVLPSNAKEIRIGASASVASITSKGTETLKDTAGKTSTEEHANAVIPSLFMEIATDSGLGLGLDYVIGGADLAGSTRTNDHPDAGGATDNDSGSNTANAEVDSIVSLYLTKSFDSGLYVKLGMVQADITTKEVLSTGSSYGNISADGTVVGIGFERVSDGGTFFRTGIDYTDFDSIKLTSTVAAGTSGSLAGGTNTIDADVDVLAAKFSVGKKF